LSEKTPQSLRLRRIFTERATKARERLGIYEGADGTIDEDLLIERVLDLLVDVQHLAHAQRHQLELDRIARVAQRLFAAERASLEVTAEEAPEVQ
jgi:hypothetical protein